MGHMGPWHTGGRPIADGVIARHYESRDGSGVMCGLLPSEPCARAICGHRADAHYEDWQCGNHTVHPKPGEYWGDAFVCMYTQVIRKGCERCDCLEYSIPALVHEHWLEEKGSFEHWNFRYGPYR